MMDTVIDTSYEPFSREPEYIEVNRQFINTLPLDGAVYILDLACGTGTLTKLLLEKLSLNGRTVASNTKRQRLAKVISLDISWSSLALAKKHFAELGWPKQLHIQSQSIDGLSVNFIQASADYLAVLNRSIDVAVMGNAIQLLDDKAKAVREVNRVLHPGGIFAFNTSFYAGSYVPGTERFYRRWMEEAISYINEKDAALRQQGLKGIVRKKGLARPAFSQPWLSRSEYEQLLCRNGFEVESVWERTVLLTQRSFETIGSYSGLASVLLSGYPIELACEALKESAGPALAFVNMEVVPRNWIEFISRKTEIIA